jgi:mediator of RNA polymerase II transcription subunit 13
VSLTYDIIGSPPTNFSPTELFPCSSQCSRLSEPCPACLHYPQTSTSPASPASSQYSVPSASSLLPRIPLRGPYVLFLDALRNALLEDILSSSTSSTGRIKLFRYKSGFLFSSGLPSSVWHQPWHRHRRYAGPNTFKIGSNYLLIDL